MTRAIVEHAMKRIDATGGIIGDQRSQLLSSIEAFLLFVEDSYASKMEIFGYQPFEDVCKMHKATKVFIDANSLWRSGNSEKSEARAKSKARKDLKCPNEEQIILMKYKEYLASQDLRDGLELNKKAALPEAPPLSDREFVDLGM